MATACLPRVGRAVSMKALPLGAPIEQLLEEHAGFIAQLDERTASIRDPEHDKLWLLRFALDLPDVDAAEKSLKQVLEWRRGAGSEIVKAAGAAIDAATASGGWDNEAVVSAAPSASAIRRFIGPAQIQTIPSTAGSFLCYVVRAAAIDDDALMGAVSSDELVDFFIYAKEVNARVALKRTAETGKLHAVVLANDLSGARLFGSSAFRDALSLASQKTASVYPGIAGPTLLLNLPPLLGALVKVFTPLFPKVVQERLRFESGPLKGVDDLKALLRKPEPNPTRDAFLADVERLVAR